MPRSNLEFLNSSFYYNSFLLSQALGDQQQGLVLVKSDDDDTNDDEVKVAPNTEQFDEEDLEVFQPSSEWQSIKPGQSIPAGLHVRMNLQTGEKEAKLMEGDDGTKFKNNMDSKKKFITIDKNVISKQRLKEALKDFRDKFHDESAQGEHSDQSHGSLTGGEF